MGNHNAVYATELHWQHISNFAYIVLRSPIKVYEHFERECYPSWGLPGTGCLEIAQCDMGLQIISHEDIFSEPVKGSGHYW